MRERIGRTARVSSAAGRPRDPRWQPPLPTLHHDLRIIGLVGVAHGGSHFFHLVLPPLFPLLKLAFGVSYTELGLLISVLFATSGLCQTPAGFLVDRIGAARVLAAGLALLGAGAILASLAPVYLALLPAAMLMGLGNSVFHPADYAILGHHVAPGAHGAGVQRAHGRRHASAGP